MTMLSAVDALFVTHQQSSGVLMQLGVEVELQGRIARDDVVRMLSHVVKCWPPLGQRLRQEWLGLSWGGKQKIGDMLRVAEKRDALAKWRNQPLDPFREPPFQLLWIAQDEVHLLAFRAHHAVVDGEAFFAVCAEALRSLAGKAAASDNADKEGFNRPAKVKDAWQKLEELRKQAQSDRSARIAVRSNAPGPIAIVERDLERDQLSGWLCAGAWVKAIHEWNC